MRKAFALMLCSLFVHSLYAQLETPTAGYMRSLNSYVRGAPETSEMMKYIDYPVNLFTGTPNIDLPIYSLSGKGIGFSLSLSYHAGGGIKISDMASNSGLGWLLSTGGEISREIRGIADELPGKGFMNKPKKVSYYDSIRPMGYGDPNALAHYNEWQAVAEGHMDLEPDIFYFSFGGYSGKFIYDENQQAFVNMNTMDSRLKFQYGGGGGIFTVTTDNGIRYLFNNVEKSRSQTSPMGVGSATTMSDPQTTSWKLTKIINADVTDSITLNYDYNTASYYTLGSSTTYQAIQGTANRSPVLNTYNLNKIDGYIKLKNIISGTDSVSLVYDATERQDYPGQYALSRIVIASRSGGVRNIFRLHTSYFMRNLMVGTNPPIGSVATKSLRLDSLTEYGNSESNANPLRHRFTYNNDPMHSRMSFGQDMWGYANNNQYIHHLAPGMYLPLGGTPTFLTGADRRPNASAMKAGILEKIDLPTGGSVSFEYEPNTVSNPSLVTTANAIGVSYYISKFMGANQSFAPEYIDSFMVDEAPDAAINGNLGGVMATITMSPYRPGATYYDGVESTMPYFMVTRATNPPYTPGQPPFSQIMAQGPAATSNFYLPNGKYYITVKEADRLNTPDKLGDIRNIYLAVSFNISDTGANASNKYMAGGLRVKSITSKDNYANTSKVREFIYEEADTTYGRLIGPKFYSYFETRISNGDQYFVRMGSNSMPGQGSLGSSVVYPRVIESVREGTKSYRTYHTYLNVEPNYSNAYPFAPGTDNEYARGKEIMTQWTQQSGSTDIVLKKTVNVYDYSPPLMPSNPALRIQAIKTMIDAYSEPVNGFAMFTITPYSNILTHAYLTSDSAMSSDFDNFNILKTWNSYTYGANNHLPLTITSRDSKGSLITQKNGYALDVAEPGMEPVPTLATQLNAQNRVGELLSSRTYKDGDLMNQMFKHGHFSGSQFLVDSVLYAEYDNEPESDGKVLEYDTYGNPLTIEGRGNRFRKYIWRKEKNLALATCTMPTNGAFVFTSFEYPNEYPILVEGARTPAYAFSGTYSYYLNGNLTFSGFESLSALEVYAWVNQGSFTANGVTAVNTGRTRGDWILYKVSVPAAATVTLNGHLVMDQLIIIPAGSTFEGNVYDPLDRIVAKVNGNMQTTFFDYDAFSRLQFIRDEKGNIIKSNSYGYQVPQ